MAAGAGPTSFPAEGRSQRMSPLPGREGGREGGGGRKVQGMADIGEGRKGRREGGKEGGTCGCQGRKRCRRLYPHKSDGGNSYGKREGVREGGS